MAREFYEIALEGLSPRSDAGRSYAVLSMQEWEGQQAILVGYVKTLATLSELGERP